MVLWDSMGIYGGFVGFFGILRNYIVVLCGIKWWFCGILWDFKIFYGGFMGFYGILRDFMVVLWDSMGFCLILWWFLLGSDGIL